MSSGRAVLTAARDRSHLVGTKERACGKRAHWSRRERGTGKNPVTKGRVFRSGEGTKEGGTEAHAPV